MDIHEEALIFGELSTRYREQKANGEDYKQTEREIKKLISFTAERLAMTFKIPLQKRKSAICKGRGTPLISLSINDYIAKGQDFKEKDFTRLDTRKNKTIQGVNILLDYSGSMFFEGYKDTIDGLKRIYAQNFIALCIGVYLQKISKGSIYCVYTPFCETAFSIKMTNILASDLDLFILHETWGSIGGESCHRLNLAPDILQQHFNKDRIKATGWFCNENILNAVEESKKAFNKNMTDVISIIITDGGMTNTKFKTVEDRAEYLRKAFGNIAQNDSQIFCMLVKTQIKDFKNICEYAKIKYSELLTKEAYNKAFLYIGDIIKRLIK